MQYDDLKVSRVMILNIVANAGSICGADIWQQMEGMGIGRSKLYYSCNVLVKRGFLSSTPGEDEDGGKVLFQITQAGMGILLDFKDLVSV